MAVVMQAVEEIQPTRKRMLEIMRECQVCTMEQLAAELSLTTVTVRHHLDILAKDGLVEMTEVRRRDTPGRPQHTFKLTACAHERFPKNYQGLSLFMLDEITNMLAPADLERLMTGMASRMAVQANMPGSDAQPEQRLNAAVKYLNECGYSAEWARDGDKFLLRTHNCPYHEASKQHSELCSMDLRLVSQLLGAQPERHERMVDGANMCSYVVNLSSES